jgi:hypothetical protein
MEDDGAWRGAVPPQTEGTDPLYRRGGLPLRAHGYHGRHRVPGLGLLARDRGGGVAVDRLPDNGALGIRAHGGDGRPAGVALGPGVAGPLRACTTAYDGEARRTDCAGARKRGSSSCSGVCLLRFTLV